MEDYELIHEAKKYISELFADKKKELNDSILEQMAEFYLEELGSYMDLMSMTSETFVREEGIANRAYSTYISQPEETPYGLRDNQIDFDIESRMLGERNYGSIGRDEYGYENEEYSEGRSR